MRVTRPLQRLLTILVGDPAAHWYGYQLMKSASLPSGTLYPMLARLEEQGLVTSQWEPAPAEAGRPPRRYYQLTGDGVRVAREVTRPARQTAPRPVLDWQGNHDRPKACAAAGGLADPPFRPAAARRYPGRAAS